MHFIVNTIWRLHIRFSHFIVIVTVISNDLDIYKLLSKWWIFVKCFFSYDTLTNRSSFRLRQQCLHIYVNIISYKVPKLYDLFGLCSNIFDLCPQNLFYNYCTITSTTKTKPWTKNRLYSYVLVINGEYSNKNEQDNFMRILWILLKI